MRDIFDARFQPLLPFVGLLVWLVGIGTVVALRPADTVATALFWGTFLVYFAVSLGTTVRTWVTHPV